MALFDQPVFKASIDITARLADPIKWPILRKTKPLPLTAGRATAASSFIRLSDYCGAASAPGCPESLAGALCCGASAAAGIGASCGGASVCSATAGAASTGAASTGAACTGAACAGCGSGAGEENCTGSTAGVTGVLRCARDNFTSFSVACGFAGAATRGVSASAFCTGFSAAWYAGAVTGGVPASAFFSGSAVVDGVSGDVTSDGESGRVEPLVVAGGGVNGFDATACMVCGRDPPVSYAKVPIPRKPTATTAAAIIFTEKLFSSS